MKIDEARKTKCPLDIDPEKGPYECECAILTIAKGLTTPLFFVPRGEPLTRERDLVIPPGRVEKTDEPFEKIKISAIRAAIKEGHETYSDHSSFWDLLRMLGIKPDHYDE